MAKKILEYQNWQSEANDRKTQEYDRRFGTRFYNKPIIEKNKLLDINEWTKAVKDKIIKRTPDGKLTVDRDLAKKYLAEAHQMKLDQMSWIQKIHNTIERFAGGVMDIIAPTDERGNIGDIKNPLDWELGFNDEVYKKRLEANAQGGFTMSALTDGLLNSIYTLGRFIPNKVHSWVSDDAKKSLETEGQIKESASLS